MSSPFNVKSYYRFFNSIYADHTISAGVTYTVNGPINMNVQGSFSSTENWQLFYQAGIYFIRNYQSGAALQLGLTEDDLATPRLLKSSGALGQQWKISARSDNTWRVTNGLLSNLSSLGIAPGAGTVPAMDTNDDDGHWQIGINQSAGTISDATMLVSVDDVVAPSTTSTVSSSSSTATSTGTSSSSIATSTGTSSRTITSTSTSSPNSDSSSKPSPISTASAAGIVIAVLALIAIAATLALVLMRRRKQKMKKAGVSASELDGYGTSFTYENEKRITPAALPVEMDAEGQVLRMEIGYR